MATALTALQFKRMSTNSENCPELKAELDRANEFLFECRSDLDISEHENRKLRRKVTALQKELNDQRNAHPRAIDAKAVFDYWALRLGKRKSVVLGPKRMDAVLGMLKHYSVDDLKRAIDGAAKVPYVTSKGRSANGSAKERHDDLELICRDETKVEAFQRHAEETKPNVVPFRRAAPTPAVFKRPLDRALMTIRYEWGNDAAIPVVEGVFTTYDCRCPFHPDAGLMLAIHEQNGPGSGLVMKCHKECSPKAVADELERLAGWQVARAMGFADRERQEAA